MRRIAANYVFPVSTKPVKNGIVEIDDNGKIVNLIKTNGNLTESRNLEFYNGVIVPGFVNSHCHLELSHLKDTVKVNQGLPSFIRSMLHYKKNKIDEPGNQSIVQADDLMRRNGIVAVGDIVNTNVTIKTKQKSKLYYHSFVELAGLGNDHLQKFNTAKNLCREYNNNHLSASIVPHAPYSVSPDLFKQVVQHTLSENSILSIHNQETMSENELFLSGSGELFETFRSMGIDMSSWEKTKKSALETMIEYLPEKNNVLLIHNIYTNQREVERVSGIFSNVYWVLCPLSNLYIENKLPDINAFLKHQNNIALGTDSLASNKTLSILDEMKVISKYFSKITFENVIQWATLNGAKALKINSHLGSLDIGKSPGINLITDFDFQKMQITEKSTVKKLA
ncbi:MAG: amidohydrolase family protein [Bacteroidota bacterium]